MLTTIIVGAGAAGITAGYTLLQQGFSDFVILEASSTYLGRIRKVNNFTDFPIDVGAEWIHVDPSILTTIVNDPNVVVDVETTPYRPKYYEWDGTQLNEESLPRGDHKFVNYTWYDFFNDYLVPDVIDKIEFNCVVTKVEWTNSSTIVTCENGTLFTGNKTILTVPVKILQDGDILFVPELPTDFVTALNVPVMATGMKVFLAFKEKFYPDSFSIDSDFIGIELDESERFFYDATYGQNSANHVLGMFVLGDVADGFVLLSEYDVIQTALNDLNSLFGNNVATTNYIKGFVQNWVDEPYIRGAYSIYEDKYKAIDVLQKPLSNTLYFAGEAIPVVESDYEHGFAHGAALSGRKAALSSVNSSISRPRRTFLHGFLTIITIFFQFITSIVT
jgi:monoamine oxidase